jgi:hypothetical protein
MNTIRKIYIKDIPELLEDAAFWKHEFLSVSRHRLYSHYKNPNAGPDDLALLLGYADGEIVGYMGVFTDKIMLDGKQQKIGWLSTWWVHPKTKGSGIGREILGTMYKSLGGHIGISQFTPSAKRVYDKSGYFYTLKESKGIKAVLRSNLGFVVPAVYEKSKALLPLFKCADSVLNFFINAKLALQRNSVRNQLKGITVDYLSFIDTQTEAVIRKHGKNHISPKSPAFFEWLKACNWVQEAPLLELTHKEKYEFSIYDRKFNIYLMKISVKNECVGFLVLQRRNYVCKVLFSYFDGKDAVIAANCLKLQAMQQNVREIICYDEAINKHLEKSSVFLYKTKKRKESIISKTFQKENFDDVVMNFGDGDCSFA